MYVFPDIWSHLNGWTWWINRQYFTFIQYKFIRGADVAELWLYVDICVYFKWLPFYCLGWPVLKSQSDFIFMVSLKSWKTQVTLQPLGLYWTLYRALLHTERRLLLLSASPFYPFSFYWTRFEHIEQHKSQRSVPSTPGTVILSAQDNCYYVQVKTCPIDQSRYHVPLKMILLSMCSIYLLAFFMHINKS